MSHAQRPGDSCHPTAFTWFTWLHTLTAYPMADGAGGLAAWQPPSPCSPVVATAGERPFQVVHLER